MGEIVEIFVFDHNIRHNMMCEAMVNSRFYDENDEILKNTIAFTANEPKNTGGNSGNFPNCNTDNMYCCTQ